MLLNDDHSNVNTAVEAKSKMLDAGNMQGKKTAQFVSLLKQYMDQRWAATDAAVDAEETSRQDACWDMSVLQAGLIEQQETWASLPSLSTGPRDTGAEPSSHHPAASRQHEAIRLLEQVHANCGDDTIRRGLQVHAMCRPCSAGIHGSVPAQRSVPVV